VHAVLNLQSDWSNAKADESLKEALI
jgi:hypothetical protein